MPTDDDGGVPAASAAAAEKPSKPEKKARAPKGRKPPKKAPARVAPKVKAKPAAKRKAAAKPKKVAKMKAAAKRPVKVKARPKAKAAPRGAAKVRTPAERRVMRKASLAKPAGPPKIIQTADYVAMRELQAMVKQGFLQSEQDFTSRLKKVPVEVQNRARELATGLGLTPRTAGELSIRVAELEEKLKAFQDYDLVETDDEEPRAAILGNGASARSEATS